MKVGQGWENEHIQSQAAHFNGDELTILLGFSGYEMTAQIPELPSPSTQPYHSFVKLRFEVGQSFTGSDTILCSANVNSSIRSWSVPTGERCYTRFRSTDIFLTTELEQVAKSIWMTKQWRAPTLSWLAHYASATGKSIERMPRLSQLEKTVVSQLRTVLDLRPDTMMFQSGGSYFSDFLSFTMVWTLESPTSARAFTISSSTRTRGDRNFLKF